jgi:hypothetical protein
MFCSLTTSSFGATIAQNSNAADTIQTANLALNQAYINVIAAEKNGANVTQLVDQLNQAGKLLTDAKNYYRVGFTANASINAIKSYSISNKIVIDAKILEKSNFTTDSITYLFPLSVSGIVISGIIIFFAWRYFKSQYYKKLFNLKPKVKENED